MVEQAGKIRRAQVDESVVETPPNEELRVGEVPVGHLDSMIQAQNTRAGMWWNPKVWQDLADVSKNIHETRRISRHYDFLDSLDWDSAEFDTWRNQVDNNEKRAQNIQLADEDMKMFWDIEDTRQKAMRDGSSVYKSLNDLRNKYLKHAEDLDKTSAYMGENFRNSLNRAFNTALPSAIVKDYEINELRAQATAQGNTNMMGMWLLANETATFGDAIQHLANVNFKQRNAIQDNTDDLQMNKDYNTLFLLNLEKYGAAFKAGKLSIDQVRMGVEGDLAKYAEWFVEGPLSTGEKATVRCTLTPDTVTAAKEFIYNLDKNKNKADAVYASQAYNELTMKTLTDKTDEPFAWMHANYYKTTSLSKGQQDWVQYRNSLMAAAADGDQQALNDLTALDMRWYKVVRPRLMLMSILSGSLEDTGSYGRAINEIRSRATALEYALSKGEVQGAVPSLIFTDSANQIIANFGYPQGDLDNYGSSIVRNGEPIFGSKQTYYQATLDQMRGFLDAYEKDPNMLAPLNADYQRAQNELITVAGYENMVAVSPKDGMMVPNIAGQNNFVDKIKQMQVMANQYGGKTILNPDSPQVLNNFANVANNLDGQAYLAYVRSIAQGYVKAGVVTPFASYKNRAASKEVQQLAADIAMWGYIESNPTLKKYSGWVQNNKIGGVEPNPTLSNSDKFITDRSKFRKGGVDLEQEMQFWFNEYNIPEDFRPTLRHTIVNVATGILNHDEKAEFDSNLIGNLLDSNFTKKGTFRHSSALSGVSIDSLDSEVDKMRNMINKGTKNLGIPGSTTTQIDYKTGSIRLYTDGAQFMGYGVYDPLRGSGVVPFQIWTNNRPADMSEGKYQQSIAIMTSGAVLLGGLAGIDTNGVLQKYADKKAPNIKVSDIKSLGIQYLNALGQKEIQDEFLQYRNSNYTNIRVQNAPSELKALLVESLNTFFNRQGTRVTKDEMNHLIDFLYTRSQNNKVMRVDVPISTYYESKGYPFTNVMNRVNSSGWVITSAAEGNPSDNVHSPRSLHYTGFAIDIGGAGGFGSIFNYNTGHFYSNKIESLYRNFIKPELDDGAIKYIRTDSRLIQALPPNIRNLKNKSGERVFQVQNDGKHYNHFHVEFYDRTFRPGSKQELNSASSFVSQSNVNKLYNNLNSLGSTYRVTRAEAKAALTLLWNYKVTEYDARSTGHTVKELMSSPFLQAQTALRQVAKASVRLGSRNDALKGLQGARYRLRYKGKIQSGLKKNSIFGDSGQVSSKTYSFQEFLQKSDTIGTSRGGEYEWEIVPASSRAEEKRLNEFVNKFNRAGY